MVGVVAALAVAGEPVSCEGPWPQPDPALSVAWVSPLRKQVGNNGWLTLVPTAEVLQWSKAEARGSVGRMLQHLGMRKRAREPRRAYKVVVFDVRSDVLCRPLLDREAGEDAEGVPACEASGARVGAVDDGCGRVFDTVAPQSTAVYRARWRDVVANGFCVLPADRFLQQK